MDMTHNSKGTFDSLTELIESGKSPEDALLDANKIVELEPNEAKSYGVRALCYKWLYIRNLHNRENAMLALNDFTKAIDLEPNEAKWYENRARVYRMSQWGKGDYDQAINDYTKAIELEPNQAEWYAERGSLYWRAKDEYDLALNDYTKAIELEPNQAEWYAERAYIYWWAKDEYDLALNDYTKAIELEPNQAEWYAERAYIYWWAKDEFDLALNDYTKAIEFEPNQAEWYADRGYLYWRVKDEYDLALNDYTKAIELDPRRALRYLHRARLYWKKENYDLALSDYAKVIELDPNQAKRFPRLSKSGKDYNRALRSYTTVIVLDPNEAEWYAERAAFYYSVGDYYDEDYELDSYDLALNDYSKAIELDPTQAEWYAARARVHRWGKENYDLAINDYTKAIDLDPNQAELYAERAYVYWCTKDEYNLALNDYKKAIDLNPEKAGWYAERAYVYWWAKNEYNLALNDYAKAIDLNPEKAEWLAMREAVFRETSGQELALDEYEEAIEFDLNREEHWDSWIDSFLDILANVLNGSKELTDTIIHLAIKCYTNVINLDPDQAKWYTGRANVYKLLNKYTSAITDCIKAAALFETTGDYISAITCYTKAIEIKPDRIVYLKRADANEKERNYDPAIKDIISFIELDSDKAEKNSDAKTEFDSDDEMEHYKIKSYFDNLKHSKAPPCPDSFDLYARSIYYRVLINRSHTIIFTENRHTENTDYESAIKDFTAAIELEPDNIIGYVKRAGAWLRKKDYDQTLVCCDEVLSVYPEVADIYFIRAVAYRERDKHNDPSKAYRERDKYGNPSDYFWFFQSAECYELAKADLIKAFEFSNSLQIFYHLIFLLYNNKKYDDVVDMAKRFGWKNLDDKGQFITNTKNYCEYEYLICWFDEDYAEHEGYEYNNLPYSDRIKAAVGSAYFETKDYELSLTTLDSIDFKSLNVIYSFVQYTGYSFTPKELVWQKLSEQRTQNARIEERNRIIADLSHSIKNLIATVIDPLQHIKQTASLEPQIIDNAIRGASLIREIVNAMNLSFKGSIDDFQYDAIHNATGGAMTIAEMVLESLKHSGGNMFDGKYFEKFMRKYFPSREAYTAARTDWDRATAGNDLARLTDALNTHFLTPEIVLDGAEACRMGNEKGSAVKLLILFQEMIFNAVKYASFVPRAERFLRIRFGAEKEALTFTVENACDPRVRVKTSGLGHVIIKNFAMILGGEPRIETGSNRYSVTVRFPNFWKGRTPA